MIKDKSVIVGSDDITDVWIGRVSLDGAGTDVEVKCRMSSLGVIRLLEAFRMGRLMVVERPERLTTETA